MKFINCLIVLAFSVSALGCSTNDISQQVPEFRLIKKFSKRVKSSEGLRLSFYGINNSLPKECQNKDLVFNFTVTYVSRRNGKDIVSLENARCLVISLIESLLKEINSDKVVRSHLANDPFIGNNIRLALFFVDENDVGLGNGGIESIYVSEGKIKYERYEIREYTPPVPSGKHFVVHEESYAEALEIVKKQGCLREL